jgi:hypothetical protein
MMPSFGQLMRDDLSLAQKIREHSHTILWISL